MNEKTNRKTLVPAYARRPLIAVAAVGMLAYFGTRLIAGGFVHHDFSIPLDEKIPFVPAFSIIYVLAYVQWVAGYLLIARESREVCRRVLTGEIIAKLICMVFFIAVPTTMARAEIHSGGFFNWIVSCLYGLDAPDNLFPSIHCLDSWICFRGALQMKKTGRWYSRFSLVFTLLVFASTVLIKQHVLVDIPAGILVAEIGLFLSGKMMKISSADR